MDSVGATFTGKAAVQGPIQPGATPLPKATSGFFGSGGHFNSAGISSVGSAVASGIGAYSSISSGIQQKAQFDSEAKSYEAQAEIVKLNAVEQATMLRKQLLADLGSANASAAARGLDVGSGTPTQIQTESIGNVESDVAKLKAGADINSLGSKTSAARSREAGASAAFSGFARAGQGLGNYALSKV